MDILPLSADSARKIIRDSLRRGQVHMFADEADDASKAAVRALLAHWPELFKDNKRGKSPLVSPHKREDAA